MLEEWLTKVISQLKTKTTKTSSEKDFELFQNMRKS